MIRTRKTTTEDNANVRGRLKDINDKRPSGGNTGSNSISSGGSKKKVFPVQRIIFVSVGIICVFYLLTGMKNKNENNSMSNTNNNMRGRPGVPVGATSRVGFNPAVGDHQRSRRISSLSQVGGAGGGFNLEDIKSKKLNSAGAAARAHARARAAAGANKPDDDDDDDDDDDTVTGHRIFMAKHYLRRQQRDDDDNANSRSSRSSKTSSNSTRYAIKRLRSIIINNDDPYILMQGMVDMATETRILCTLPTHPNIIKLRAVGGGNSSSDKSSASSSSSSLSSSLSAAATATVMITPFHEDYFIVLDKLYCTLQEKWLYWKKMEQSIEKKRRNRKRMREVLDFCSKPRLLFTNNKRNEYTISSHQKQQYQQYEQQQQVLYSERINACCDIASAISHLHKHNIIHRDIKPQNIGYNIRGDIVLFDFGLSREIPTTTTTTTK
mmetsp:Transcript_15216/g.17100  ORF Transcript_15216/g.17100 Transcript_15216/m.17100 type:complete len:438 (+) Transcript_15216:120-1433(+)